MKIVHFTPDEKFIPLVQSLFDEAYPGCNTYLMRPPGPAGLRYVSDLARVRTAHALRFKLGRWLLPEVRGADLLVVHGMNSTFARGLAAAPPGCTVVWIGWGYDYYALLEPQLGPLLLEATARLAARLAPDEDAGPPRPGKPPAIVRAAGRIDLFSVNPSEVALLRRALPALRAAYHALPSFTVEDVFAQGPAAMHGEDILLGNSASATNNHLEALELLQPLLAANRRRLVVPLSYGQADYADAIEGIGRERWGARFVALRRWLPIAAYNAQLADCGIVVMNHRRQKAVGNITAALYKGAKVFLRPENPLYGFYTGLGAVVHTTEALQAGGAQALAPLDAAERERNRAVVVRRWGRAAVLEAVRALAQLRPGR